MSENIRLNDSNFCIGPQTGTYCSVDVEASPAVMRIKNSSGTLIRTYTFSPSGILASKPYDILSDAIFLNLKYVGPLNQSSIYSGAIFYTLELVPNEYRKYYTYERDDTTGGYKVNSVDKLLTSTEFEYHGNIIRKWRVNNTSFTLDLVSSSYKISDSTDWIAAESFSIQTYQTTLLDHVTTGTGVLPFTTTSGLSKYDTILIGPSSDTDNISAVEEVYIHSIDESKNEVFIRTYSGGDPTLYEYVEGDPVTVIRYAHLPSKPRPLLDSDNVRYAYESTGGTLLSLDLNDYCEVVDRKYGAMFFGIQASDWNPYYNTVSFIKNCNLFHYDLEQEKVVKSQFLLNMYEKEAVPELIPIYDISFNGTDIYRLQKAGLIFDNTGRQTLDEYSTYNYVVDALEIYSSTVSVSASDTVVGYQGVSYIKAVVRDQFGVGLLSKDVSFSIENDVTGFMTPADGNVTTDADGVCSIQYTAGAGYNGVTNIMAQAVGANSGFGSVYAAGHAAVSVESDATNTVVIKNVDRYFLNVASILAEARLKDGYLQTICYARRSTPGGEWLWSGSWADIDNPTIDDRNSIITLNRDLNFLMTVYQPTFNGLKTDADGSITNASDNEGKRIPSVPLGQNYPECEFNLPAEAPPQDSRYLSQNYLSRHLSFGNIVTANLNQFAFTQEAIPNFWSDRNTPEIDYWIRLRPFSYSLDPTTLEIFVYEVSWAGVSDTVNIAPLGAITMFDAGSGLEGIDFTYKFPESFHNNSVVFVKVVVYDKAPLPNIITVSYWFKIVPDYLKPYILNHVPAIEEYDVNIDTGISFDVLDRGDGVDISTLEVFINNRQVTYSYVEYEPGQFNITCDIEKSFVYSQEVKVNVFVKDLSDNANLLRDSWTFYCISSSGPWFDIDNVSPGGCLQGVDRSLEDISAQVYAINNTGIDYDSLRLDVGGKYRCIKITPIIYRLK